MGLSLPPLLISIIFVTSRKWSSTLLSCVLQDLTVCCITTGSCPNIHFINTPFYLIYLSISYKLYCANIMKIWRYINVNHTTFTSHCAYLPAFLTTQYSVPFLVLFDLTPCFCKILPNTLTLFAEIGIALFR